MEGTKRESSNMCLWLGHCSASCSAVTCTKSIATTLDYITEIAVYTACTDIRQVCIFTIKPYSSISHNFQFVGYECMSYHINELLHFDSQIISN